MIYKILSVIYLAVITFRMYIHSRTAINTLFLVRELVTINIVFMILLITSMCYEYYKKLERGD